MSHIKDELAAREVTQAGTENQGNDVKVTEPGQMTAGTWSGIRAQSFIKDRHTYAMLLHVSQLLAVPVPLLGLMAPVLLWLWQRDDPLIDAHGRVVANWMLSLLLYTIVATAMLVILVGFLGLALLFVANIVQVILGAIRARDGEVRHYPLAIRFFKVPKAQLAGQTHS